MTRYIALRSKAAISAEIFTTYRIALVLRQIASAKILVSKQDLTNSLRL